MLTTMMMNNVVAPCCAKRPIIVEDQYGHRLCHRGRRQMLVRLLHILAWWGAVSTMIMWLQPPRPTVERRPTLAIVGETDDENAVDDDVDVIAIDHDSTLGNDVAEIIHYRRNATVVVTMHQNASCRHPVLRGRLSGPALAILEWERHTVQNRPTQLMGRYDHHILPTPATTGRMLCYYVEIIALLCEEWDYDTNFQPVCLEDPERHRVTARNASIMVRPPPAAVTAGPTNVVVADADDANVAVIGRWVRKHDGSIMDDDRPLYTRWQRKTCGPHGTNYCPEETGSLDRFQPYEFIWQLQQQKDGDSLEEQIKKVWWDNNNNNNYNNDDGPKNATTTTTRRLCYVGDSHAEQLFKSTKMLLSKGKKNNVTGGVVHYYAQYPQHVNRQLLQEMRKDRCQHVVIGIGQW
jgi:hypothetical protein